MKGLYKIDPDARLAPGKVSEMFLEFAQPLIYIEPSGPPDIDTLRHILKFAEMCWNLPVVEREDKAAYALSKAGLDRAVHAAPKVVADRLLQMLRDRTERFGAVPFFITARVEGDELARARVVAEARMAKPSR